MPRTIIELRNVTFGYSAEAPVLTDASLEVCEGEVISVTGQSGCGKTTLGLLCAGLIKPVRGVINVAKERGRRASPVQMTFQDPYASINPRRTIRQWLEIARNGAVSRVSERGSARPCEDDVNSVLDLVGLSATDTNRYPGELSGGQLQRVSIAAAMLTRPSCLICDEPVSMLDNESARLVFAAIARLIAVKTVAVVMMTHETDYGISCDKHYLIKAGRVVQTGRSSRLLDRGDLQ